MIRVSTTIVNLDEVSTFLKGLPESSFKVYKTEIARTLFEVDASVKSNTELARRTGTLMRSITTEVSGNSLADLNARVYTTCIYARVHEEGATIRAKNAYKGVPGGPYLNIPGEANKTAAGVTRMQAREVFANGGFIMGKTVMRGGDTPDRRYDVMFFLTKEVYIPPRLNLLGTVEGAIPTLLSRITAALGE